MCFDKEVSHYLINLTYILCTNNFTLNFYDCTEILSLCLSLLCCNFHQDIFSPNEDFSEAIFDFEQELLPQL